MSATFGGNPELVELLIQRGAMVDLPFQNGDTALALASLTGHLEIMRVLISHGADVNHQNKSGQTPLMDAAMNGHEGAMKLLLKAGARTDLRSKRGLTAEDYAKVRQNKKPAESPSGSEMGLTPKPS